jgi:hypothetical protein
MILDNNQVRKDYAKFKKLFKASKELLDNYTNWLETNIPANEKESERLYANLKEAVEEVSSSLSD